MTVTGPCRLVKMTSLYLLGNTFHSASPSLCHLLSVSLNCCLRCFWAFATYNRLGGQYLGSFARQLSGVLCACVVSSLSSGILPGSLRDTELPLLAPDWESPPAIWSRANTNGDLRLLVGTMASKPRCASESPAVLGKKYTTKWLWNGLLHKKARNYSNSSENMSKRHGYQIEGYKSATTWALQIVMGMPYQPLNKKEATSPYSYN